MESPPTHTRTGSVLLATHTSGGGVVGVGVGVGDGVRLAAPALPSAGLALVAAAHHERRGEDDRR